MKDLNFLNEIDRSIISIIKEYSHNSNYPEFIEIFNKLEVIENKILNDYPVATVDEKLNELIKNQDQIRKEIYNELEQYNKNDKNQENILKEKIEPLINNFIINYNKVIKTIKNMDFSDTRKDTI